MAFENRCRETGKAMQLLMLWILGFLPLAMAMTGNVSDHDELEIANLLKKLNKPYVKSIKSLSGDIIDCVPFHLQPAFDNPLNKNVTYENVRSRFRPEGFSGNRSSDVKPLAQLWHRNGRCPEGTVPIIRTTREDILRAGSIENFGKKISRTFRDSNSPPNGQANDDDDDDHEYAVRRTRGRFRGTKVRMGVWMPSVQVDDEFSLAQIWIHDGLGSSDFNSIEAGWQVYPQLYRDVRTRLFGFWTKDNYRHGCYNLRCSGFIQVSNSLTMGGVIDRISVYGIIQNEMTLFVYKKNHRANANNTRCRSSADVLACAAMDPLSSNWWLEVNEDPIGYWPANLLSRLATGPATGADWGGEVINDATNGRHTKTEMGSGSFSTGTHEKAAAFRDIRVLDEGLSLVTPRRVVTQVTNARCYDLTDRSTEDGLAFSYGGPGRNPNCP